MVLIPGRNLVPAIYTALKLAGTAYLLWPAFQAVRPGGKSAFTPKALPAQTVC